ncbi:hypothetical protein CEG14_01270 [Bordetella genomosp. 1]|uniref:DUF3300 domain-containing protein n=1 Tax=Bordetella genomosp. 1 TaxID=1395607 RepID=A0A261STT3_9BORD|nr:DUF3300 domain-containing protein [Bordetella genomosp. 1]OZI40427.1 hypothetical protein CEG14_01270 [Bordetella genomosp. 1]
MKRIWVLLIAVLALAHAPAQPQSAAFGKEQLDQMLAPVALYPDALLSQLLMASTYPDDVKAAAAWASQHGSLQGDAAVKAAQDQAWDPSVISLVGFPSVIDMMGRQPDWVLSLGNAFLDQPDDVMASVQRLRQQAQRAGNLASNAQQKVSTSTEGGNTYISVAPASPQTVYVPTYNPGTVYGTWPYPAYPPAYYPPPPGSAFASALVGGLAFGTGIAIADSLWGGFDWGHNDVDIDVNRYNNINVNRRIDANRANVNWSHDPARRGAQPYRGGATQQRFDAGRRTAQTAPRGQGAQLPGAQRPADAQQARRDHAQQVMRERGSPGGARPGGQAGGRPGAQGAGQHRATPERNAAPQANRSRNEARSAAAARSRDNNRDNALRGAGGPRQAAAAPHPRPAQQAPRAAPHRDGGGGGRHIERSHGRR